jgi:hypothetical protein
LGKLKVIIANSASIFLVLFREDINFPKESCNSSFFWWDLSFKALILSKKVWSWATKSLTLLRRSGRARASLAFWTLAISPWSLAISALAPSMIAWSSSAVRFFLAMAALTVPKTSRRYETLVPHGIESSLARTWRVFWIPATSPSSASLSSSPLEGTLLKRLSTLLTGVESSVCAPLIPLLELLAVTCPLLEPA